MLCKTLNPHQQFKTRRDNRPAALAYTPSLKHKCQQPNSCMSVVSQINVWGDWLAALSLETLPHLPQVADNTDHRAQSLYLHNHSPRLHESATHRNRALQEPPTQAVVASIVPIVAGKRTTCVVNPLRNTCMINCKRVQLLPMQLYRLQSAPVQPCGRALHPPTKWNPQSMTATRPIHH